MPASASADLSDAFLRQWSAAMRRVGADPVSAARVAFAETGMYQRHPRNPSAGIFPLITSTLHRLGWDGTAEEWTRLSPEDQLPWVEAYLKPYKAYLGDEGLIYVATFLPAHLKRASAGGDGYVLTSEGDGTGFYESNRILDRDGDGRITVGDLKRHLDIQDRGARWEDILARLGGAGGGVGLVGLVGIALAGWGAYQLWKEA